MAAGCNSSFPAHKKGAMHPKKGRHSSLKERRIFVYLLPMYSYFVKKGNSECFTLLANLD